MDSWRDTGLIWWPMKPLSRPLAACAGWLLVRGCLMGQFVLSGSPYVQDFNEIGTGLPDGWAVYTSSTATTLGTTATFTTALTSWAGSTTGTSFRNISGPTIPSTTLAAEQALNPDRALGLRPLNAGSRDGSIVFAVANTAGYEDFQLGFDVFTANNSGSTNQTYNIEFRVGTSGPFILLGTYETTSPFGVFSFSSGSSSLALLNDQLDPVYFRLHNAAGASDSSYDTLAIDNFTLSYSAIPEPSTYAMIGGLAALACAAARRFRRPWPRLRGRR